MGTGAEWVVPAIISAISTGAGVYETKRVASDQDAAAAQGIRQQQVKQREADARVNEEIGALEQSSPEDERRASLEKYMQTLRSARGTAEGGGDVSGASARYAADNATSKAAIGNYGDKFADILSRVQAASDQRQNENYSRGRMGADVSGIAREASGDHFLNRLRLSGIQRDPWVDAGSEIGQGIASGMAANAGAADGQLMGQATRSGYERVPSKYGIGGLGGGALPRGARIPNPAQRFG